MGELVELDDHRPHWTGPCRCQGCGCDWVAVVPEGADLEKLECPECGEFEGFMPYPDPQEAL